MKPIRQLLTTAVAYCITNDEITKKITDTFDENKEFFKSLGESLDKTIPGFSLLTTIGKELTKALAPEIMGSLVEKIEYSKIRDYLITPNPINLNRDLSKLLKDSALTALGYIKILWFETRIRKR